MRVAVITPPEPVVTWEEAERHLRLDGDTDERVYVESLIAAATGHIDGPDGWLGRALGPQVLEARLDNFDCGSIRLPYPPTIEVLSVGYVDDAGTVQTIAPGGYELMGPSLVPAFGGAWPRPRWQREAVRVRYRAGYADGVPAAVRAAILLMVGDLYAARETFVAGATSTVPMSTTVDALLGPLRVWC